MIPPSHRHCPVGHATALLGDRWTLMIVREALRGADRYDALRSALAISDHTLSRRLRELADAGILVHDPDDGRRYVLTDAGADLARVLAVLGDWGMRWCDVERPLLPVPEPIVEAGRALGLAIPRRRGPTLRRSAASGSIGGP